MIQMISIADLHPHKDNPKAWQYWMYDCAEDPVTGEKYGWGRVLDYIGVDWEDDFCARGEKCEGKEKKVKK